MSTQLKPFIEIINDPSSVFKILDLFFPGPFKKGDLRQYYYDNGFLVVSSISGTKTKKVYVSLGGSFLKTESNSFSVVASNHTDFHELMTYLGYKSIPF